MMFIPPQLCNFLEYLKFFQGNVVLQLSVINLSSVQIDLNVEWIVDENSIVFLIINL